MLDQSQLHPAMSQEEIHKLLETKRYAVETIEPLEKYVSSGSYDFEADHALLKLYQFHPSKNNTAVIAKVLVRALAQVPAFDFVQHLYLIPESVVRKSFHFLLFLHLLFKMEVLPPKYLCMVLKCISY